MLDFEIIIVYPFIGMTFSTDLKVLQLLCALLQEGLEHPVPWFQTIFPGNLLRDSQGGFGENSLSLQPEVVLLQLTTEQQQEKEFCKWKERS